MIGAAGGVQNVDERRVSELETMLKQQDTLDDPLAVHEQLCLLLSSAPSRLLPALERATRSLAADQRYLNDPRHLKLWLAYTKHCRQPQDVFLFLMERGIGRALAAFYEEWAWCILKNDKNSTMEAERVLKMGIDRGAQPLERLKMNYEELTSKGQVTKRSSLASSEMTTSWTTNSQLKKEVTTYCKQFIDNGKMSFEEARAKLYYGRQPTMQRMSSQQSEDEGDETMEDIAQAVNPDDLTHISVYRDTTADVRELAKVAKGTIPNDPVKSVVTLEEGLNRSFTISDNMVGERIHEALRDKLCRISVCTERTMTPFTIGKSKYFIEKALGERTFLAVDLQAAAECDARVVLKKLEHRELAVLSRSDPKLFPAIINAYIYNDCAVVTQKYYELGNLKRLLVVYEKKHQPIDNRIVLYFTHCLIHLLVQLSESGWICNSISLDHLLLKSSDAPLESNFKPDGCGGWGERGLLLTGMPLALRTDSLYISNIQDVPIGVQIDWQAVAQCVKELLHAEDTLLLSAQWLQLLEVLKTSSPSLNVLNQCLTQIEPILCNSGRTGSSLKSLLVRLEMALIEN